MYISETDEKTEKSNIQGVEIHPVKINNNEKNLTVPVLAGDKHEEETPCRLILRKVALTREQ